MVVPPVLPEAELQSIFSMVWLSVASSVSMCLTSREARKKKPEKQDICVRPSKSLIPSSSVKSMASLNVLISKRHSCRIVFSASRSTGIEMWLTAARRRAINSSWDRMMVPAPFS